MSNAEDKKAMKAVNMMLTHEIISKWKGSPRKGTCLKLWSIG